MVIYGEISDGGDGGQGRDGTGRDRRTRGGRAVTGFVGVCAFVLVVVGVVLTRPDGTAPPAAAAPSSDPTTDAPSAPARAAVRSGDILGQNGIGGIEVGMSERDYRELFTEPREINEDFAHSGTDDVHGCTQYTHFDLPIPVSVWVRDSMVVTVGVTTTYVADLRVATAFDLTLGGGFDIPDEVSRWSWDLDTAAPVPVARLIEDDSIVTVADTDADGVLDFASVGTLAGDDCQVPGHPELQTWFVDVPGLEAGAFLGVSVGMPVDQVEVLPEWQSQVMGRQPCLAYWANGGTAYVRHGVVIGIAVSRVVDGPSFGQTMNEAVAAFGIDGVRLAGPEQVPFGWQTVMTLADGQSFTVYTMNPAVRLDRLDTEVRPPVDAGDRVIHGVLIGESCDVRSDA